MSELQNIHWADEEEVLEQYLLGKVSPDKRRELDAHTLTCEKCRNAVRRERQQIAGIKRYGRDQLKGRIANQVHAGDLPGGKAPGTRLSWQQVASIAAVILIVTGIGIYNRWFFPVAPEKGVLHERRENGEPRRPATDQPVVQEKDRETISAPQEAGKLTAATKPKSSREAPNRLSDVATKNELKLKQERKLDEHLTASEGAAGARIRDDELASQDEKFGRRVWIEGTILSERRESTPEALAKMESQKAPLKQLQKTDSKQRSKEYTQTIQKGPKSKVLRLAQQPWGSLPLGRQVVQSYQSAQKIQTLVARGKEEIKLTLYVEPLFDDSDLASAIVRPISDDSLIIVIHGTQIGFRIPGGWAEQKR